jgi:hypothetical protein
MNDAGMSLVIFLADLVEKYFVADRPFEDDHRKSGKDA